MSQGLPWYIIAVEACQSVDPATQVQFRLRKFEFFFPRYKYRHLKKATHMKKNTVYSKKSSNLLHHSNAC